MFVVTSDDYNETSAGDGGIPTRGDHELHCGEGPAETASARSVPKFHFWALQPGQFSGFSLVVLELTLPNCSVLTTSAATSELGKLVTAACL